MKHGVIDNVIRSQIVEDYLLSFESKELEQIVELFSDDCYLSDWDVGKVSGKNNVIEVFSNIFDSVGEVSVNIKHIHEDINGILICEMDLNIDNEEMLVVDIFEFDEEDKIKALRAYKGN